MIDTVAGVGLEDPAQYVRDRIAEAEAAALAPGQSEVERAVWIVTIAALRAGLERLAAMPIPATIAWPAGINKAQRRTILAQLDYELKKAHLRRLAEEFVVIGELAPAIALGLGHALGDVESKKATGAIMTKLAARPTLARRILEALGVR